MSELTIDAILERWRAETASADHARQRDAGTAFERLCIAFLTHDPEQRLQYGNVSTYGDWAAKRGAGADEAGIDLVAELADGSGHVAVQCKFYAEGLVIPKSECDKFLSESNTADFVRRIIIDTTGRDWSSNLERTLKKQLIPVVRHGLHNQRASPIGWAR